MSKQFLAVLAIIILAFIGIVAFSGNKTSKSGSSNTGSLSQHIEGMGKSGVTLVEYGDYQCPYCGQYYSTIKQAEAEFNTQIHFQFRNFPLTQLHPNAFASARAAEAAALQGKFWQMHDLLYEQNQLYYNTGQKVATWIGSSDPTTVFNQDAQQIGLNVNKFKTDYASTGVNDTINADLNEGNNLNVSGTPSFFIDGKKVTINNSLPSFESVIKAEITKKTHNK